MLARAIEKCSVEIPCRRCFGEQATATSFPAAVSSSSGVSLAPHPRAGGGDGEVGRVDVCIKD